MPACVLELKNFNVNQLHFNNNSAFSEETSIKIEPHFNIEFFQAEQNGDFYKIVLGCKIFDTIEGPFKVSAEVEGEFEVENSEKSESIIQYNAVAILMPYVRSLITQLTALAEKPPVFFPIVNIYSLMDGENEIEEKSE